MCLAVVAWTFQNGVVDNAGLPAESQRGLSQGSLRPDGELPPPKVCRRALPRLPLSPEAVIERGDTVGQQRDPDKFVRDLDVIAPVTVPATPTSLYHAFAFNRQCLTMGSRVVGDLMDDLGDCDQVVLSNMAAATVKNILHLLATGGCDTALGLRERVQLVAAADELNLGQVWLQPTLASTIRALQQMTAADMQDLCSMARGLILPHVHAAAVALLSRDIAARSKVVGLHLADLLAIVDHPRLALHENQVWRLVDSWCQAHFDSTQPELQARQFRAWGLHRHLRWHEMTQAQLSRCTARNLLLSEEITAVEAIRQANGGYVEGVRTWVEPLGVEFPARCPPQIFAESGFQTAVDILDRRALQRGQVFNMLQLHADRVIHTGRRHVGRIILLYVRTDSDRYIVMIPPGEVTLLPFDLFDTDLLRCSL